MRPAVGTLRLKMAATTRTVSEALEDARAASLALGRAESARKDAALTRLAGLLRERSEDVLTANAADLADERAAGLTAALRDRLTLTAERVEAMAEGVEAIVALPDPVGEEIEQWGAPQRDRDAQGPRAAGRGRRRSTRRGRT